MAEVFPVTGAPRDCPLCRCVNALRLLRRSPDVYECGNEIAHEQGCGAIFRFGPAREGFPDALTRIPPLTIEAMTEHERMVLRGEA